MEDTLISIIGIIIALIIMFFVPMIVIADRADDISQLAIQTNTAEFVNEVVKSGKITEDQYQNFINRLSSTGNKYDIDIEIKILDKNTAKSGNNNTTYSIFTRQIEEIMGKSDNNVILLKQGDSISVTVQNSSKTLSQSLKSFYYNIKGSDVSIIAGTAFGTIAINGTT